MTAITETLGFLVDANQCVSFDEDDQGAFVNLEERQAQYCQDLVHQLEDMKGTKNNIRDLFSGNISSLTPVLCNLLSNRIDTEALMPATQDVAANEEALSGTTNAMTLTFPAMMAAELYATLLSTPGALGSGLVEMEALTILTTLMRRWVLECCGREDWLKDGAKNRSSPTKSPPKKKSRFLIDSSNDVQDGNGPQDILKAGIDVAVILCKIPKEREFSTWSSEARETLLEGLLATFAAAAAMKNIHSSCSQIIKDVSEAVEEFIENSPTHQLQDASVVLLRGLLRILQFKEILPNGERGKLDAHASASHVLEVLIQTVSQKTSGGQPPETLTQQTPSRNRRISGLSQTPGSSYRQTPKSQRRRVSVDGLTPMTSPALKKGRHSVGSLTQSMRDSKPNPILSVFLGMLQKLATSKGFERASARTPTVETLQRCIDCLPLVERAHFLRYLLKLCQSKVSIHRLVACEIIGSVLAQDWLQTHAEDTVSVEVSTPTSHDNQGLENLPAALWRALQGRLVDRIAAVRARAAASLEAAIEVNPQWMKEDILSALRKRALSDETATVRKASLFAITKVLLVEKDWISEWYLSAICELCQDQSILTRKAAGECLTNLLECYIGHPFGHVIEEAWSNCVLPMVLDEEAGSKAILLTDRVVISPILESEETEGLVAWRILSHIGNMNGQEGASKGATQALQCALKHLQQEDCKRIQSRLLKKTVLTAHQAVEAKEASETLLVGVMCLLDNILAQLKDIKSAVRSLRGSLKSFTFCVHAWQIILKRSSSKQTPWIKGTLRSSLLVASKLASALDSSTIKKCQQSLQRELENFSFSPSVIGAAISALGAGVEDRKAFVSTVLAIYACCEVQLAKFVQVASDDRMDFDISSDWEQKVVRALFTVGELSMIGFRPDDDERNTSGHAKNSEADMLQGLHVTPPARLQQLIQTMLSCDLPGQTKNSNPVPLRAHAFTVLGKLCLRDDKLTKNSLNLFARELHPSAPNPSPAVQSNALVVLGDLSVRYTIMTDRYLPVLASCLQAGAEDPEVNMIQNMRSKKFSIVRKHAVLLLSSLLLQDYIKWRGLLFHRFLVACSDDDEGVAHLAENVLSGPLWVRNPKLFYNNFVESLFVLNKCTAHPIYVAAASHGDGGSGIAVGFEGIHLNGVVGETRRRKMYDFLLSKLSDEEKIGVTARLAKEVLGGAVSNSGDLGRVCEISSLENFPRLESAWNVMNDAFYILTHRSIKVGRIIDEEDIEDPNVPSASRQVTVAKSRLLSKINRKQLIEIILPILCNLKAILQRNCSPLLKHLMGYFLEIFQTYKVEVKEFLANDLTLLHEIEYDARQHG